MNVTRDEELDALMARLADGDRGAFTPVFRRLWPRAVRYCRRILGSDADASDAAQTTMKKVLERAAEYDRSRPALPWALTIALWECRTLAKRSVRRREAPERRVESDGGAHEAELIARDLLRAALAELHALSRLDREALTASFWEESASVSGSTLRKRRERALGRLRQAFFRHHRAETPAARAFDPTRPSENHC